MRAAFRSAGRAIIASNALLVLGFSMLYLSDFEPTRRVAVLMVTTISSALVAALTVLPALIILFERMGFGIVALDDAASSTSGESPATSA